MAQKAVTYEPVSVNLEEVYDVSLHNGLTTYKTKHSNAPLPKRVEAAKIDALSKKGAVFVVRSKEDFQTNKVKGYIVTSKETLLEDATALTHFTPNVYRKTWENGAMQILNDLRNGAPFLWLDIDLLSYFEEK